MRYNSTFFQVPGLVETTSSGGIPEHNGFYASFPFNQQQQSSIHLESFSMQNIMKGAPPTPAASRPQTSSSVGMTSFAAASSAAAGADVEVGVGGRGEGEGRGRAAVFNAEPPLNTDDRVGGLVMHITHHTSHITHHTSHITHHTSHITHRTSNITHQHITHHTSHIAHHTSHITHHTSHIIRHTACPGGGGVG